MMTKKSNNITLFFSIIFLFLFTWYDSGIEKAFHFSLFIVSTFYFIINMINGYILFMDYKFDFRRNYKWWIYFFVSTPLIIMLTIIFQVKFFLIISSTISLCVLTTLLLYDQIRRFLKRFFR